MSRELDNWLESYLVYTQNSEPPTSYHTWSGLSLIAGALQRKVYIPWGIGQVIYPNMFVVLVGASGRTRKGVAINIAKELLTNVAGVSVAPEATSREALILAMKRSSSNFQDPVDQSVRFHCSITAFSEELSVLLGQRDIKFLSTLTDWYDSKDLWAYETIGRGRDELQGVCLNILGATAPDWIQSMLPQEAIGGGFTSRVIFIVEEQKGKTVPKHELTGDELVIRSALVNDLDRIAQLSGPINFTPSGERAYIDWYVDEDKKLKKGQPAVDDPRFAGYCERRATHIRKLMMISSAARNDSLEMDELDFTLALRILLDAERNMHKTFGGLGKSPTGDVLEALMEWLSKVGSTTRTAVMQRFYRDIDSRTLEQLEQQMLQMKVIEIKFATQTNEKMYKWIGKR